MHYSDEGLIDQLMATPDERLFTQLYQRYYARVYASALRFMREEEEARDQTQEIFCKVHTRLHTFRRESSFSTWLFALTRHQCISALYQQKKYCYLPLDAAGTDGDPLQEELSLNERWNQAQLALDRLPIHDQQLLYRYYLGNKSVTTLATEACVSQSAIKMRLKRARDQARLIHHDQTRSES